MQQPIWNFEQEPRTESLDETGVNLRAYFDRMDDAKIQTYQPGLTDDELIAWDGNFRDDGALFILCCERDVGIEEYREVLEQAIAYRNRIRPEFAAEG